MPHYDILTKCPYYMRENQTMVFCEAVFCEAAESEMYCAHVFPTSREKNKFLKEHCSQYPNMDCPYAAYVDRFYEEGSK